MFCYQCEQRSARAPAGATGWSVKDPAAALQDLLVWVAQGVSVYAHEARQRRQGDSAVSDDLLHEADIYVVEALFTTVTNVNFDPERIETILRRGYDIMSRFKRELESPSACPEQRDLSGPTRWEPADDLGACGPGRAGHGGALGRSAVMGPDVAGTMDLVLFGLKGMAAYVDHAMILGVEDEHCAFIHEAMSFLTRRDLNLDDVLTMALRVGEVNIRAMQLLDQANTGAYGHPVPTRVRVTPLRARLYWCQGTTS